MKKIFRIRCLEDDRTFSIGANTAYEALYNMMYTLNLKNDIYPSLAQNLLQ